MAVPAGRFDVETINVDSINGGLINEINDIEVLQILLTLRVLRHLLVKAHEIEFELQEIDGFLMLSCVYLEDGRHKPMREEESREPEGFWIPLHHPLSHELNSLMQILKPWCQRLLRGICDMNPVLGHLIL